MIEIRQLQLSEKSQLLSFLKTAYASNPRQSDPEYWDWHFLNAPYSDHANLPVWIAVYNGRIVGQLGAIEIRLIVNGKELRAIWILDLIIDPEFRRLGLASSLAQEAEKFCPVMLGTNTPEQHSTAVLERLGWRVVGKIPRYHKLLFPGEAIGLKPAREIANLLFAPFRPNFKGNFNENICRVEEFDNSFDELWKVAAAEMRCMGRRDSGMLNWQYMQQPDKRFEAYAYRDDGRLLGYVIIFFRKSESNGAVPKASIIDILYHPDHSQDVADALLKHALRVVIERRAGSLMTDVVDPLIESQLSKLGFMSVKNPLQLLAKTKTSEDIIYDLEKWFLTRGDSDISIFERPNL